jgi:hypothetical protein
MRSTSACICALLLVGCQPQAQPSASPPHAVVEGDLVVSYMVQTNEHEAQGDRDRKVQRITFADHYIVIQDEGGGRVLPISRLQHFNWRTKD